MIFIYFKFPPVHFADACFLCKGMLCYIKSEQCRVPILQTLKRRIDQGSKRSNTFSLRPPPPSVWFNCSIIHYIKSFNYFVPNRLCRSRARNKEQ